jgi:CheY-like chemotaxis protein
VLKNAVKFNSKGGRITIETRISAEDDKIAVKIIDTGIGLTPQEINRIFNAFSQGDHATSSDGHRFDGLGLGLTISRMLVELHSGVIHATSAGRGQGSTFVIELPLVQMNKRNGSSAPSGTLIKNGAHHAVKKKSGMRILLVEDHEPTRTAMSHLLTRRDCKVISATSVAEARALARRENFDLVVSDIGLPDGNGYTLMSELRDEFGLKGIALTGYGMEQDVKRGQNAGFVAYLIKPVRIESLEKALSDAS